MITRVWYDYGGGVFRLRYLCAQHYVPTLKNRFSLIPVNGGFDPQVHQTSGKKGQGVDGP